ncbi:MAG TPA: permease-like cell division protein FtsX, partial [Actinomycetota bacterium]|nr:permease-like cell division protein FtsX [Actinomycetota bacterium]
NQPEILQNASPDALPESFRIKLKDPRTFTVIRDRLEGRPGVRTIRDERETVKKIFAFTDKLHRAAVGMAVIVGLAALVQIATTIRMAIYARRREIQIMKLVGATNWFIRVPFMLEGVAQGAIGAAIAMLLLLVLKPAIASISPEALSDFRLEISMADLLSQGGVLLGVGMGVGAAGSLVGLRRFLDV